MSQFLPVGKFAWVEDTSQFTEEKIKLMKDDQDTGFLLEVDLEYPQHLHDKHDQVRGYLYQYGVEFCQKMIGAGLTLFWGRLFYFSGGVWT